MKDGRNPMWSAMKGIAITSVVIGHCTLFPFIERFVNQYHLAVFFFVSGYFFKERYIEEKRIFVWKKMKKLYLLFVISGIVFLLFHPLLTRLHVYDTPLTWKEMGNEVLNLSVRLTSNDPMMGAMWFCPALMGVSFIAFVAFCLTKGFSLWKRSIVFLLMVTMGGVNIHLIGLKSPYCIWQYMIVVGIYYMGWLFSQYEGKLPQLNKVIWGGISMLFLGLLYFMTDFGFYGRLQPASINKESVVMLLLIALIGCGMIYALAKVLDMTLVGRIMAIVGDYSFSIMLLHFLSFKLINWIQCLVYDFPFDTISDFPFIKYDNILWFLLYVVAGTSLPIVASLSYHTLTERVRSRYRSI